MPSRRGRVRWHEHRSERSVASPEAADSALGTQPRLRNRGWTAFPPGIALVGATPGSGAGVCKHTCLRTRSRPSDCGVAPSPAVSARPATAGRTASPLDVVPQPDKCRSPCESPEGESVKRPTVSFSHSGGAASRSKGALTPALRNAALADQSVQPRVRPFPPTRPSSASRFRPTRPSKPPTWPSSAEEGYPRKATAGDIGTHGRS